MSRARDWTHPITGEIYWFDSYDSEATASQLEVLAEMEDADLDDLLDERLSTKTVLYRLNDAIGAIPIDVIQASRLRRSSEYVPQVCRFHDDPEECEGIITKHHFVPKWLMLELPNYLEYAPRNRCTIPACTGWHRFLHLRSEAESKSVAPYLTDEEKQLTHLMIAQLREHRPKLYALIAGGNRNSYEWQLIHDWRRGLFDVKGLGKEAFPRWRVRLEA